jgi:hypothetical protein
VSRTFFKYSKKIPNPNIYYSVGDLPFKTIDDYEVTNTQSFSSMKVRKRHVQFKDLSFKQLFDQDYYLRNNVAEQVEIRPQPNLF